MTQAELKTLFTYKDGKLYRRIARSNRAKVGEEAGWINENGYRLLHLLGRAWRVHRLIYLYHYGKMPEGEIDHINHKRLDNRIENLRVVTTQENARNRVMRESATTIYPGVYFDSRRNCWYARATVWGKFRSYGTFDTAEEAISMRLTVLDHYGFHENHGMPAELESQMEKEG